ncbi:SH3 domain-containing protein [Cohaesibacter intestini]|uniref:SH3 domain-containing protein n=1 Tax=Cohaesibacter intestini TaxID=2211145 RepID=UPI000DEAA78F|nr:SH3 domain-containing protein [Cohaesibacter intestini]
MTMPEPHGHAINRRLVIGSFLFATASLVFSWALPLPANADYVGGLNPYGDNFLTLRQYPSSKSRPLARMAPNTILDVLDADGVWYYVRTQGGLEGWAHSKWIYPGYPSGRQAPSQPNDRPIYGQGDDWVDGQTREAPLDVTGEEAPTQPSPDVQDPLDWVRAHMETFHDPLKY